MKATAVIAPVNIEERKNSGIKPGDTVRVWQKIKEGDKTRLQAFEGVVISRKHGVEPGATFTVRKVTSGVGVEKTFPLYSPIIDKVEIVRRAKVRRAKLYYIRDKAAREIRKKMRQLRFESQEVIGVAQKEEVQPEEEKSEGQETAPVQEEATPQESDAAKIEDSKKEGE